MLIPKRSFFKSCPQRMKSIDEPNPNDKVHMPKAKMGILIVWFTKLSFVVFWHFTFDRNVPRPAEAG